MSFVVWQRPDNRRTLSTVLVLFCALALLLVEFTVISDLGFVCFSKGRYSFILLYFHSAVGYGCDSSVLWL